MRDQLSIDVGACTAVFMLSPADGKDSAPCMIREPSFWLDSPQSTDQSAYSLAQCMINTSATMGDWAQSMLQGGASWPAISSPHEDETHDEGEEKAPPGEESAQTLSLTLSSASFGDENGAPPVLEWTASGLDGLLSRGASGLDAILNAAEEEDTDSNLADFHVDQQQPYDSESMDCQDGNTQDDEQDSEPAAMIASPSSHTHLSSVPADRFDAVPARFDAVPGVQRAIQKPRRRRRRNQQPRGAHVKNRPEMQEAAREGQKHWGAVVQELRQEWEEKRVWEHQERFREQIQMAVRTHIKSQHECILRQLQIALVEGIVTTADFSTSEEESFLGWTGFQVVPEHQDEFRARVESMFAVPPKENTLNNAFRRAGLIPKQCWSEAWKGRAAFFYDGSKRATYTNQQH